jgi:hypothetical protein
MTDVQKIASWVLLTKIAQQQDRYRAPRNKLDEMPGYMAGHRTGLSRGNEPYFPGFWDQLKGPYSMAEDDFYNSPTQSRNIKGAPAKKYNTLEENTDLMTRLRGMMGL